MVNVESKLRVLLDTNIYDWLVKSEFEELVEKILLSSKFVIYGADVIRKELRETPKSLRLQNKSLRNTLLNVYDLVVKNHSLKSSEVANFLAAKYMNECVDSLAQHKLNDFLIVAMASLARLDVVCSEDNRTLKSAQALRAYRKINSQAGLRTPRFVSFEDFRKIVIFEQ